MTIDVSNYGAVRESIRSLIGRLPPGESVCQAVNSYAPAIHCHLIVAFILALEVLGRRDEELEQAVLNSIQYYRCEDVLGTELDFFRPYLWKR